MILAFDLDNTLCESKMPISDAMRNELVRLMSNYDIAIVSGGKFESVEKQVLQYVDDSLWPELHIFSVSGGAYSLYRNNSWQKVYWHEMRIHERTTIETAMKKVAERMHLDKLPSWGDRIDYRQSQITYSLLGQDAPLEQKQNVDPNHKIKKKFVKKLRKEINGDYTIGYSKTTSVDVNMPGIDKSLAVNFLEKHVQGKVVYFGDRFGKDGNDAPVLKKTSAECISVKSPDDLLYILKRL